MYSVTRVATAGWRRWAGVLVV